MKNTLSDLLPQLIAPSFWVCKSAIERKERQAIAARNKYARESKKRAKK